MSGPEPSLIQQRFALQRKRAEAVFTLVGAGIGAIFAFVLREVSEPTWPFGIAMVLFTTGAVIGGIRLRQARAEIRAFEEQHGADAGVQD